MAGIAGVYELFTRFGRSGGSATKSLTNLFADFPLNNVEDVPHKTSGTSGASRSTDWWIRR